VLSRSYLHFHSSSCNPILTPTTHAQKPTRLSYYNSCSLTLSAYHPSTVKQIRFISVISFLYWPTRAFGLNR
jgi:hypothetical protein